jgi:hypothetical protein
MNEEYKKHSSERCKFLLHFYKKKFKCLQKELNKKLKKNKILDLEKIMKVDKNRF